MVVIRFVARLMKGIRLTATFIASLVTLVVFIVVIVALIGTSLGGPHVPRAAALVINPQGRLVEQYGGDPGQRAVDRLVGRQVSAQTRLDDVLAAIHEAKSDSRIKALVIDPREMAPAPLAKMQTIAAAVRQFRKTGKPVFAILDMPSQSQYYLAAMADKVFLNPQGGVLITGFGAYREYYKDAIDKLGIDWNVFRVGKYKSFVEPFTRNGMSPAAKKANRALLSVLWGAYKSDVAKERGLQPKAIQGYVDHAARNLAAVGGDAAKLALKAGLVDKLLTRHQAHARVAQAIGKSQNRSRHNRIGFHDYLLATDTLHRNHSGSDEVAVIIAEGDILAGEQPPGKIGGRSLSQLIRKARKSPNVKALVLRVDSPGGSAFASQMIMQQERLMQKAGKPVVVSMGSVAASGGYWISMAADRIYAKPTTITGSIGIFGMLPTFQKSLAQLGIHNDGVGTTVLAGDGRLTRAMTPQAKKIMQSTLQHGYHLFVSNVSKTRNLSMKQVRKIAQGRVWSGKAAKRLGLIDDFGGLSDAIKAAAQLAGIADHYTIHYIKQPLSFRARLLMGLSSRAPGLFQPYSDTVVAASVAQRVRRRLHRLVSPLGWLNDPQGVYAYCFCAATVWR